jgi:hypothetical protein
MSRPERTCWKARGRHAAAWSESDVPNRSPRAARRWTRWMCRNRISPGGASAFPLCEPLSHNRKNLEWRGPRDGGSGVRMLCLASGRGRVPYSV